MARVDEFYAALKRGDKPDFARALDCGTRTGCGDGWVARLLEGTGPMEGQWEALFRQTGLATAQTPSQAQRDAGVLRALVKLMKDDCQGRSGSMPTPDGVVLDGMKACKTFVRDAYVTAIEGLPVSGHAGTGAAMTAACASRRQLMLGLKEGGTLAVPCGPLSMRATFYHADIVKVLAALGRD